MDLLANCCISLLILWSFPIGPGVPVFVYMTVISGGLLSCFFFSFIAVEPTTSFPNGPGVPVFVYIIIGVVILAVFLLFLCFLAFLSKHLYKRWQIQNAFKVRKPL